MLSFQRQHIAYVLKSAEIQNGPDGFVLRVSPALVGSTLLGRRMTLTTSF
jgi:hypothetical protein